MWEVGRRRAPSRRRTARWSFRARRVVAARTSWPMRPGEESPASGSARACQAWSFDRPSSEFPSRRGGGRRAGRAREPARASHEEEATGRHAPPEAGERDERERPRRRGKQVRLCVRACMRVRSVATNSSNYCGEAVRRRRRQGHASDCAMQSALDRGAARPQLLSGGARHGFAALARYARGSARGHRRRCGGCSAETRAPRGTRRRELLLARDDGAECSTGLPRMTASASVVIAVRDDLARSPRSSTNLPPRRSD